MCHLTNWPCFCCKLFQYQLSLLWLGHFFLKHFAYKQAERGIMTDPTKKIPIAPIAEKKNNVDILDNPRQQSNKWAKPTISQLNAVALRYDKDQDPVPRVLAKGQGAVAEQILELAYANGISVREDAALTSILSLIETDSLIPLEAFAAVAEIIAYLYHLNDTQKNTSPLPQQSPTMPPNFSPNFSPDFSPDLSPDLSPDFSPALSAFAAFETPYTVDENEYPRPSADLQHTDLKDLAQPGERIDKKIE